ncbi:hypothetical protein HYDPIDRAFT_113541 [Hydnomerulius pinastri MD-312]|uniref:Unplaced genomic scaffold scaffold_18, whole genome shotgun sequence n=1 Tax=Hydnomerulius pinastri MD-312 TaxID=994086 RepID=A0A0C9WDG9_9AGAM|nr:hypothetical protein HYDPIDRAFT_113541 [Hydnomerulius pinastri MD-312]
MNLRASTLLLLSFLASTISASEAEASEHELPCRVQAWVRAPDLVPGEIIEGDARIKLDGDCPEVESYALGLRLKEASLSKTRIPQPMPGQGGWGFAGRHPIHIGPVWNWHKEVRLAFEAKIPLTAREPNGHDSRGVIQDFALLVPYTNYPPGVNSHSSIEPLREISVNTKSVYEYFAEIQWANGTCQEVLAGITAFQPLTPAETSGETTVKLIFDGRQKLSVEPFPDDPLRSIYTADIQFADISQVVQGSKVNASMTIFRTGYNNRTDEPLCVNLIHSGQRDWPGPGIEDKDLEQTARQLGATNRGRGPIQTDAARRSCRPVDFPKQDHCRECHGVLDVTASNPIWVPLHIDATSPVDFSAVYQNYVGRLTGALFVAPDPSEPMLNYERKMYISPRSRPDDEYDWIPWTKERGVPCKHLSGNVSLPVWSHDSLGPGVTQPPVHYLSPEARAPIFVDSDMVPILRDMTVEERDAMAPVSSPHVSVIPKEESINKYYGSSLAPYVGETWANKVLPKLRERSQGREQDIDHILVVQQN